MKTEKVTEKARGNFPLLLHRFFPLHSPQCHLLCAFLWLNQWMTESETWTSPRGYGSYSAECPFERPAKTSGNDDRIHQFSFLATITLTCIRLHSYCTIFCKHVNTRAEIRNTNPLQCSDCKKYFGIQGTHRHKSNFPLGGKFLSQKSSVVHKHDFA